MHKKTCYYAIHVIELSLLIPLSLSFQLNVNEFCDNITLHAKNLTIDTKKIELTEISENEALKIRNVELMPKHDFLIIYPQKILSKFRKYVVKIPFEGTLDTDLIGYYRSSYYDKEYKKRV